MPKANPSFVADPNAYVRLEWGQKDVDRFLAWQEKTTDAQLLGLLGTVLQEGLEVRVLRRNDGVVAVLRDPKREGTGQPFLLSGWSSEPLTALAAALYKHTNLAHGDWSKIHSAGVQALPVR